MAVVWRAFDTSLERDVALKEPLTPPNADEATAAEFSRRFVREGKAAARLNHPGIVTIYSADIYDGRPVIAMELIEGRTLSAILEAGPIEPHSVLAVLDQLLEAVDYAHCRGVVHRDIKPENVFIGEDGRVKLADFGIAHVESSAALTQAGTIMGTPGYMAPEQVVGAPVGAQADIFAIGVIAYEMLTGRHPFGLSTGIAPATVMYRIVHEAPAPLGLDLYSPDAVRLADIVSRAMAKSVESRYQTAEEMRLALYAGAPSSGLQQVRSPTGNGSALNTSILFLAGVVAVLTIVLIYLVAFPHQPVSGRATTELVTTSTVPVEGSAEPGGGTGRAEESAPGSSVQPNDGRLPEGHPQIGSGN
ncbi:MAG: serine/threonine protein kinase [Coriobacteriia bacterium]|nr:serine/threonine protein kinase [Coriobacteriia bacterium]